MNKSFKQAYAALYTVATLHIVLGALGMFGVEVLGGTDWTLLVTGSVFGLLAVIAHKTRSLIPPVIGAAILAIDVALTIYFSLETEHMPVAGIVVRAALFGTMLQPLFERVRHGKSELA